MDQKKMSELLLFLIFISCQTWFILSAPLSSYLVSSFTPPDSDSTLPFNHIVINNITGDVYIGARERLYQLDSDLTLQHTGSSALCVYKMSDVQQRFEDAVLGCIQGTSSGTANSYLRNGMCPDPPYLFKLPDSVQCTAYYEEDSAPVRYYRYASGTVPLSASPIFTIPDVIPTSIVTTMERHHTVAFIGDKQGYLQKMNIVNGSFAYAYEYVFLGDGSVLQEMFLDESIEQLTISTSSEQGSKVLSLDLFNCSQYQSCKECIGEDGGNDGDPYCGWCSLEASRRMRDPE
eukprot:XP_011676287.1 PREDICTED: plexin-B1-like [Strongylocentrotus purpuratus]